MSLCKIPYHSEIDRKLTLYSISADYEKIVMKFCLVGTHCSDFGGDLISDLGFLDPDLAYVY